MPYCISPLYCFLFLCLNTPCCIFFLFLFLQSHTHSHSHSTVPVAVDEGVEGQSIIPATGEVNHIDLRTEIMDIKGPTCECSVTPSVETLSPQYWLPFSSVFIGLKTSFHFQIASLCFLYKERQNTMVKNGFHMYYKAAWASESTESTDNSLNLSSLG